MKNYEPPDVKILKEIMVKKFGKGVTQRSLYRTLNRQKFIELYGEKIYNQELHEQGSYE